MRPVQLLLRCARSAARWCVLLLGLAVMVACGPGTGGTGTGQTSSPLEYFGATPANVCKSSLALALACPPPSNTGAVGAVLPPSVANGTDGVWFATTEGADINLTLSGNMATLIDRCLSLTFSGEWGTVGSNDPSFFGEYTTGSSSVTTLGSLNVQVGGNNKDLTVSLRDVNGRVVIGAVTLRRVLAPTSNPEACNR